MNNYNPFSLEGKTSLITGASSGIGRQTAIECSKMGANVIALARSEAKLDELIAELNGNNHYRIVADLSNHGVIKEIVSQLPAIDGFVSNAGVGNNYPVQFFTEEEIQRVFSVNMVAPMLYIRELIKQKKLGKGSCIVFTSSAGGVYMPGKGNGIYEASKSAIHAYMRTAALELGRKKIRVNSVNPSMVDTDFIHGGSLNEEQLSKDMEKYALGRYGTPRDIALAIVYLLSDAASWITGTDLKLDGGRTLYQ